MDFCGVCLCCLQCVRLGHSRCVLVYLAWVNWITRLKEWKACSSWAKKDEIFGFLLQRTGSCMFLDHLGVWCNEQWCPWSVVYFCSTLLPWLLCLTLTLLCLKLLVVFEETFGDILWFNCRLNFSAPLCGCGTELNEAGSSSFVMFLEYISWLFFQKWSCC